MVRAKGAAAMHTLLGRRWRDEQRPAWLQRRTGAAALTRGDNGELEQWRWHVASDSGGDAALEHGDEVGEASDRGCRLRTWERVSRRGVWHARWRQRADEQARRGEREADSWDLVADFILN
jgi:hypothetical protein